MQLLTLSIMKFLKNIKFDKIDLKLGCLEVNKVQKYLIFILIILIN